MATFNEAKSIDKLRYKRLSHLCYALKDLKGEQLKSIIRIILQHGAEINYAVPFDSLVSLHTPNWVGYTSLHFAVYWCNDIGITELLKYGADVTIKDYNGSTPLHLATQLKYRLIEQSCTEQVHKLEKSSIHSMLSMHITNNISTNPIDKYGLSHFHIACMVNHTEAVSLFLNNGVSINSAINTNSSNISGYTPLHLAVQYNCVQTVDLLLKRGANFNVKNGRNMTPLHVNIEYKKKTIELISQEKEAQIPVYKKRKTEESTISHENEYENNEIITELLLKADTRESINTFDNIGLSHFHVACTKKIKTMAENFLEQNVDKEAVVNFDSPICPGYTPLHFAADFNYEIVELLVMHGADITAKDVKGVTPLDICICNYGVKIINLLLKVQFFNDVRQLRLLYVLLNLYNDYLLNSELLQEIDVNTSFPLNSPIWPGYTLLHLVFVFDNTVKRVYKSNHKDKEIEKDKYNLEIITLKRMTSTPNYNQLKQRVLFLLRNGADITAQDANGTTPLHLALKMGNKSAIDMILSHHTNKIDNNPINKEGLSHFHIACIKGNYKLVKIFLEHGVSINDPIRRSFYYKSCLKPTFYQAGSTPLHISIIQGCREITKLLLQHGANILATDADGSTVVHLAAKTDNRNIINLLFSVPAVKRINAITNQGLSHFHVACMTNNPAVVEEFLQLGVDINSCIKDHYYCSKRCSSEYKCTEHDKICTDYAGYTALHFAVEYGCPETVKLLVNHGANIHAKNVNKLTPLDKIVKKYDVYYSEERMMIYSILSRIKEKDSEPADDTGLTKLHIACYIINKDYVEHLLKLGINVNSTINCNSSIWSGYTPLHVIAGLGHVITEHKINQNVIDIIKMLLANGADVTMKCAKGKTPLHLAKANQILEILFAASLAANVNPMDNDGLSHFHIACEKKFIKIIEGFLKNGENVNDPSDIFSRKAHGRTPLHYTMSTAACDNKVIKLLLEYGADVNAENFQASTVLHYASLNYNAEIIDILLSVHGVNINAINIFGKTPLETAVSSPFGKCNIKVFLKYEVPVNLPNPLTSESPLSLAIRNEGKGIIGLFVKEAVDILNTIDMNGRNMLHVITAGCTKLIHSECADMITCLLNRGCDINYQDKEGRTPIHTATEAKHVNELDILLTNGADLNIVDHQNKTAFMHSVENLAKSHTSYEIETYRLLARHVNKMRVAGCQIHKQNSTCYFKSLKKHTFYSDNTMERYSGELDKMKNIYLSKYTTLKSVLMKDANEMVMFVGNETLEINLRENNLKKEFPIFGSLLKMQYIKGLTRKKLVEPAKAMLELLFGLGLPDPCSDSIIKYLSNTDLYNVIASINR